MGDRIMTDAWSFRLLGELEVANGSTPVRLGSGRLRAALVTLLLRANQTVSVEELVDRLWGDAAPSGARGTAQTHVMRLRQALGDQSGLIETRPGGYVIKIEPGWLDLSVFRAMTAEAARLDPAAARTQLRSALALWRGPALADIPSESLRRDEVPRLAEERLLALERRVELDLELGCHGEVVGELASLTAQHPYRERFRYQLMLAMFRAGRQADALESYRDVRARLDDELGIEPGPDLRELHAAILRNDPKLHLATAPPVVAVVPRQLPADAVSFAGRDADLAVLDGLADGHGMVAAVIHGTAGVGKTALAVHWSHRVSSRFPDGQLVVNLRGFDPDHPPADPGEALGGFLRALGVDPGRIPHDTEERAALYRSTIADRRLLVVLDNAATVDQVRPLLPGTSSCLTLVTSRNQLTGLIAVDGAHSLQLDVLDAGGAMRLLRNVLGSSRVNAEPDAAGELVRLCGYLPLALRLAAGKLHVRPRHSIAGAVDELTKGCRLSALEVGGDSRAAVRPAFDMSYRAVRSDEQELFRRLGLVPGPDFTVPAAAALIGASEESTTRLLDGLVVVNLVESHAPGRYRLHDLVRLYARDVCAESEKDSQGSLQRLLDWYVTTAEVVAATLYPSLRLLCTEAGPGMDKSDAWAWLETELPNLTAAADGAVEHGLPWAAWRIADATRGFFLARTYHIDMWHAVARTGLAAAEQAGDKRAQAAMHINLGTAHWGLCDYQGFLEHSIKATELAHEVGWTAGEPRALSNTAHAYMGLGRTPQAVEFSERALRMHRASGASAGTVHTLRILGQMHAEMGNLSEALAHFQEALVLAREAQTVLDEADALNGLGRAYLQLGDFATAGKMYTAALTAAREQGARFRETVCLGRLAEIACATGRMAEADELVQQALRLVRDTGRRHLEVDVLNVAGRIAVQLGQSKAAIEHHHLALGYARDDGNYYHYGVSEALLGLANAYLTLANHEDALLEGKRALDTAQDSGYRVLHGKAATVLAEIELARHNNAQAATYAQQALELHRATGHRPGEDRVLTLLNHLT